MAGDYSRFRDQPKKRYSEVLLQQGRVQLDSDWNEASAILTRRQRTMALDVFGHCAAPRATTPSAFLVGWAGGAPSDLSLGTGRYYADGRVAEIFDDDTYTYRTQPFLSFDTTGAPADASPKELDDLGELPVLVYLDVFDREVTSIEDPELLEVALGGPDTTTRLQTVWQVKLYSAEDASCATELDSVFPPSGGRLSSRAVQAVASTDPCILPDSPGYRGIENRLFRVEIHTGGDAATAKFKWSRDNASIVSRVERIDTTATDSTLTVTRIGRDPVLRFEIGDWVEIIDDRLELWGQPGFMAKVDDVVEGTRALLLDRPIPADLFDPTDLDRHTRVRRWDQKTGVDGNGLLSIAAGWVALVDGVEVQLSLPEAGGNFHTGDYWVFAARSADASVEELTNAPPRGIIHHYCPLATISGLPVGEVDPTISDCRTLWPPLVTGGEGCECTRCVTPESHADGSLPIQRAIDEVREAGGGKVCLEVGEYPIDVALDLSDAVDLILRGRGGATRIIYNGGGPALIADDVIDSRIERLAIESVEGGMSFGKPFGVTVEECIVRVESDGVATGPAIALGGILFDMAIKDCFLAGTEGITTVSGDNELQLLLALELQITGCLIVGEQSGIALGNRAVERKRSYVAHAHTLIARNEISGGALVGIDVAGLDIAGSSLEVRDNSIGVIGFGVAASAGVTAVRNNLVLAGSDTVGSGEVGLTPAAIAVGGTLGGAAAVEGNVVGCLVGHGIQIGGFLGEADVSDNVVNGAGHSGIVTVNAVFIASAHVSRNRLENIGTVTFERIRGIGLDLCASAQVDDNTIFHVAAVVGSQAPSCAAIDVVLPGSAIITANQIGEIGATTQRGISATGIEVTAPVNDVTIADNAVHHQQDTANIMGVASFTAIKVGGGQDRTGDAAGNVRNNAIYDMAGRRSRGPGESSDSGASVVRTELGYIYSIPTRTAFIPAGSASAGIQGNVAYGVESVQPVIDVSVSGALTLTHNRVDHSKLNRGSTAGGASAATSVLADSPAVSAGHNVVRTDTTPAMMIQGGSFAVLGNMTTTEIWAGGVPLTGPWDTLNVTGI